MNELLQVNAALATVVSYSSLKASVLIVLVLLTQKLFSRWLSARGHYWLWLAVVLSLVTPVGFVTKIPQLFLFALPTAVAAPAVAATPTAAAPASLLSPNGGDIALEDATDNASLVLPQLMPLLWLTGVLVSLFIVLTRSLHFASVVRQARPASSALHALLDASRRQADCRAVVNLCVTPAIDAPLVTSCWRPVLLLPEGIEHRLNEAQLRHVFLHELLHVRSHDIAVNWLLLLLQALHWFNPLVWLGFSRLRQDRELVCDAATMNLLASTERQAYGRTLLLLSQPFNRRFDMAGALGIADGHRQLKRRITMIVRSSLPSRVQTLVAGVLMLLFGTMAFSKPTLDSNAQESEVAELVAAPLMAASVAQLPAFVPAVNQVKVELTETAVPARTAAKSKRIAAPHKAATPATALTGATAQGERSEFVAAAEPVLTLALAQTAVPVPAVAQPAVDTTTPQPETYADWNAIQALSKAALEARDPAVKFITEVNAKAATCSMPLRELMSNYHPKNGCGELYVATQRYDFSNFWAQCRTFIKTHNRLATNFARAPAAQFVDGEAVSAVIGKNYQTLSEFCNTDVYRQKYPNMLKLLHYAGLRALQ